MNRKAVLVFAIGIIASAFTSLAMFTIWSSQKVSKIHTLKSPLLLSTPEQSQNMHLLPKGTTLYFDRAYPEGFSRYKIYINIDRMPLELKELSDPTTIIPIEASAPSKDDLRKLLRDYPLSKDDLASILKSGQLSKGEIKQLLTEFSE